MGLFFHVLLPLRGCCTGFSVCRPVSGSRRNRVLIPGHHIEVQVEEFITVHLGNQRHVIAESTFPLLSSNDADDRRQRIFRQRHSQTLMSNLHSVESRLQSLRIVISKNPWPLIFNGLLAFYLHREQLYFWTHFFIILAAAPPIHDSFLLHCVIFMSVLGKYTPKKQCNQLPELFFVWLIIDNMHILML